MTRVMLGIAIAALAIEPDWTEISEKLVQRKLGAAVSAISRLTRHA